MGTFLILRRGVASENRECANPLHCFSWGGGDPLSWMGAFLILRRGVRERESGMRQSIFSCGGGGDPFSWMGTFLILRCGVRERELGMRQSTSSFFLGGAGGRPPQLDGRILDSPGRRSRARIRNAPIHSFFFLWGGDPFSWMGTFLILRCGVRERESGMRQSTSLFFFLGGGGPFQLDGRILDSPVRRSRARIGNAPIHSVFFPVGGGPFQLDGRFLILRRGVRERESGMRQSTSLFFLGGGDPFSWMGAFLILRCGVRERESGMRQSTSLFFLLGGGCVVFAQIDLPQHLAQGPFCIITTIRA